MGARFLKGELHPVLHLGRGLVGEGHRENGARLHALVDQVGDPGDESFRFAGAGASENDDGAFGGLGGLPLFFIQCVKRIHERRNLPLTRVR